MSEFIQLVYTWYNQHRRDLPWRKTNDPYKIWISEIILQQTRVDQGLGYYLKFTERFPDVGALASAREDSVLKLWQGLGYYSRARNLHASAKIIMETHQGSFPRTYDQILKLKGIGPYTAAAIASIAFGLPHPVLDGNVYRFLSRYFGINDPVDSAAGKKTFYQAASELLGHQDPGFHNQAFMEFGALQCTPGLPDCTNCPLANSCHAYIQQSVTALPVKAKKTGTRNRYFCFYLIENDEYIWLEKRRADDIWKNLYQFPGVETPQALSDEEAAGLHPPFMDRTPYLLKSITPIQKHVLSHQVLYARLIHLSIQEPLRKNEHCFKIKKQDFSQYAVPKLIEKLAKKSKIL